MELRYVQSNDREFVMSIDRHVSDLQFQHRVYTKSGYIMWEGNAPVGLMTYCVFWDRLPFLNLIYIKEEYRGRGFGAEAMKQWEADMKNQGYKMVLISTQADESAQHFYRRLGYVDCGGLLFDHTPLEQPMELFMRKVL